MTRPTADFVIDNAATIATCTGPAPRRGVRQRDIGALTHAVIAAHQGTIVYVGPAAALHASVDLREEATRIDASGCTVTPGFVDAHTHIVYAGDRRDEMQRRLAGATYTQIAAEGGGILSTVAATRLASENELIASTRRRLDEMLACGITTCEAKSGYGLTTDSELKQLRVLRTLDATHHVDVVATFLGAHEVPPEYRHRRADYVSLIVNEMIPRVASEHLARYCDVFCDEGIFSPDEAASILEAGRRAGLVPRIHAEELGPSGGSFVAAQGRATDRELQRRLAGWRSAL